MKRLFLILLLALFCADSFAYAFEAGGIYYNRMGGAELVGVTYKSPSEKYAGDIVIPATVTYDSRTFSVEWIDENTFKDCTDLTSVEIPNSVIFIGASAFSGCTGLTSFTIGNSVTHIEEYAFLGCTGLTDLVLEDGTGVLICGSNCFQSCPVKNLHVGRNASGFSMNGNTALTNLTIGNSVTSLSGFFGCTSLTKISVAADNPNYSDLDGVLFNKNQTGLLLYPKAKEGAFTIPNSVTSIGSSTFSGCTGLTSVEIPNSVTFIGEGAFEGCTSLTDVTFNEGDDDGVFFGPTGRGNPFEDCSIKKLYLGRKMTRPLVADLTGLTSLTIGYFLTSGMWSEEQTFKNCTNLTSVTILNSATAIVEGAFEGCTSLSSIEIPNSVTSIGSSAFDGCRGLTSVTIPNSVTTIGYNAFGGCTSLTSIEIPNSVTSLSGFNGCTGLTSVAIPNSVTSIGGYAFSGCTGLTFVAIPNSVTSIGYNAFGGCTSLTSIEIPNSVTSLSGFNGCTGLTSVEIPNSVTAIGEKAFEDCTGLTTLFIPMSVLTAANGAFSGCNNLTDLYVNDRTPNTAVFNGSVFEGLDRSKCTLHVSPGRYQDYDFNAFCAGFTIREQPKTVCSQTENIIVVYSEKPQRWERSADDGVTWDAIDYTGSFYTAPPAAGSFLYRVVNGNGSYSETVAVIGAVPSGVAALPAANTKTADESVTFTLDVATTGYNYQWYRNDAEIAGATGSSHSISVLKVADTGSYRCEISNDCGMVLSTIASLTVNKAPQAIAFDELSVKTYGDGAFDLPETTDKGLTAVYQSSNTDVAVVSGNTIAIKGAGGVDIVATQPGNENYLPLAPVTRRLTVKKAPLTITAKDMERRQGEENPEFILLYDGFRHTDAAGNLDLLPTAVCSAGLHSPKGSYDIVLQGGYDRNYEYTLRNGTLLVTGGVAVDGTEADGMAVYPNPVSEYFYIAGMEADTPVTVSDVSGKVVLQSVVAPGEAVSVAHLPGGIYIVRAADKTVKMVKL